MSLLPSAAEPLEAGVSSGHLAWPGLELTGEARLPTRYGLFRVYSFQERGQTTPEHLALVYGQAADPARPVFVRVHSECVTGDIFGSLRCDCGPQLDWALKKAVELGHGVVVYLRGQEGRGVGLTHKLRAYELQDQGQDTVDANLNQGLPVDARRYDAARDILALLGVAKIRLATNNPDKIRALNEAPLDVVERIPVVLPSQPENRQYLETKRRRLGHLMNESD